MKHQDKSRQKKVSKVTAERVIKTETRAIYSQIFRQRCTC